MQNDTVSDEFQRRREQVRRHPRLQGIDTVRLNVEGRCLRFEVLFIPPWPGVTKSAIPERLSREHVIILREGERVDIDLIGWQIVPDEFLLQFRLCPPGGLRHGERWTIQVADMPDLERSFQEIDIVVELSQSHRHGSPFLPPKKPNLPDHPAIDYLAKDYESFRRVILERIRKHVPDWREQSEADLGIVLAELLAYTGDRLSYWQDTIATETYLQTARLRTSARRHAQLLDYEPSEGCAPWLLAQIRVNAEEVLLPTGTVLLTGLEEQPPRIAVEIYRDRNLARFFNDVETFETVEVAKLYATHQTLLVAGGIESREWTLQAGSTRASVYGSFPNLRSGDFLLLEQTVASGSEEGATLSAHVVQLSHEPEEVQNPVSGQVITHFQWEPSEALPQDFAVRRRLSNGVWADNLSVFRGNLVLAELGRSVQDELLPTVSSAGVYRPQLSAGPVLYGVQRSKDRKAAQTEPRIALTEYGLDGERQWRARPNLIESRAWSRDFVVENDATTKLRFGDGRYGLRPAPGTRFRVSYRVGDLRRGSVGAGAIRHVVSDDERLLEVCNPLPAVGATLPESADDIRINAPEAHWVQERCVTPQDYIERCRSLPGVHDATAVMKREAAHNRITVYVERVGGQLADRYFRTEVRRALEPYRLLGSTVHVRPPNWVSLLLELQVVLFPDHVRATVKRELQNVFLGNPLRPESPGLFSPGSFVFGEPVLSGRIVEAAMSVQGVSSVTIKRLQPWSEHPASDAPPDQLTPGAHQIVRLADDKRHPEHGQLVFDLRGGRS